MRILDRARGAIERRLGGRARALVIGALAAVLALDTADSSAIGSMAKLLGRHFGVSTSRIGLLVTVSSGASAIGTLAFGWLADRAVRTRVLAAAILGWGAVCVLSGVAPSYGWLLVSRVALGLAVGAALPLTASLVGDWFPPRERARVYGWILAGELFGTAIGFAVAGELASFWWRLGFLSLAVPAPFLAWALRRLPEPARGGADRIPRGAARLGAGGREGAPADAVEPPGNAMRERVRAAGIRPDEAALRGQDPGDRSLWRAFVYVLRVRTNLVLIAGSALAYYFFASVRVFGLEFLSDRFRVGHAAATWIIIGLGLGGLAGVWAGGHAADALLDRGRLRARPWVVVGGLLATAALFAGALLVGAPWLALGLFFLAAAAFGAVNPPLDAARLDVVPPSLWGRAEAVRAFFRDVGEGAAPFVFGWLSGAVLGGGVAGLRRAFLVMIGPLLAAGLVAAVALRTYLRDVATADAQAQRARAAGRGPGGGRGGGRGGSAHPGARRTGRGRGGGTGRGPAAPCEPPATL